MKFESNNAREYDARSAQLSRRSARRSWDAYLYLRFYGVAKLFLDAIHNSAISFIKCNSESSKLPALRNGVVVTRIQSWLESCLQNLPPGGAAVEIRTNRDVSSQHR